MGERSGTQSREYVVFEQVKNDALRLRGKVRARSPRSAIRKMIGKDELGTFYAIPEVTFRPHAIQLDSRPVRVWVGG